MRANIESKGYSWTENRKKVRYLVSPYMINLHTCIEAPCNIDANKMLGTVPIE